MNRRILLIANPVAGRADAAPRLSRLQEALSAGGNELTTRLTGARGDGRRFAAEGAGAADLVCAFGGDGTLNEVLCGVRDAGVRVPVAFFPGGTANVTAAELGLPETLAGQVEVALRGARRILDLIDAGDGRVALMCAGAGLDAAIVRDVSRTRTAKGISFLSYAWPILRNLFGYQFPEIRIEVDGQPMASGRFVVVGNMRRYGGPFTMFRKATPDDEYLDVCCMDVKNSWQLFLCALYSLCNRMPSCPYVRYGRGREVKLGSDEPVPVQLDGDAAGELPLTLRVVPAAVELCVPRG